MAFLSIGFPGLGLEQFSLNRTLFTVGRFGLSWYGLIIAAGFLAAVMYALRRVKEFNLTQDEIIDMLICAVPAAVVGARLYYCLFNWSQYRNNLTGVFKITEGGLAIYGGVIGAFIAAGIFCRVRRIHAGAMFDIGALGLLIGQAAGRWGNFFNIEVYGVETSLPWRMTIYDNFYSKFVMPISVHPLFLYESLWNILGFALLHLMSKKYRKFNGQIFLCYVAWYGLGRGFMESLRSPEYILSVFGGSVAVSQLLAFVSAALALLTLGYLLIFRNHEPETMAAWVAARDAWRETKADRKEESGEDTENSDSEEDNIADIDPEDYTPRSLDEEEPEPGEEEPTDGDPA